MKSINRFLIDKGYSGNDEEISILKMVELVDEWQGDSQNITVKLIQFTKALSECMKENLRLESQLKESDRVEVMDCNDCIFENLIDRGICGHPEMDESDMYLDHKAWNDHSFKQPDSCPLKNGSIIINLKP